MDVHYDERFLLKAIELAAKNAEKANGGPFAAIVVKDGIIISEAVNTVTSDNDPTAHAEVNAIRKACKALGSFSLQGCQVYASCEPCPMCLGAIFWARPQVVYYAATQNQATDGGFDDSFIYQQIEIEDKNRKIPFIHKNIKSSNQPFELWNINKNNIKY